MAEQVTRGGSAALALSFTEAAPTAIYTLSLHDALPISPRALARPDLRRPSRVRGARPLPRRARSEEHTSELQSQAKLVCRLLLEKKNAPCVGVEHRHDVQDDVALVDALQVGHRRGNGVQ